LVYELGTNNYRDDGSACSSRRRDTVTRADEITCGGYALSELWWLLMKLEDIPRIVVRILKKNKIKFIACIKGLKVNRDDIIISERYS
jgi:hypothetical protein